MQLTEEQIEAIITKACGKYRTGDSYTFEDVWNCIEKALAAHSVGAQEPVAWMAQHRVGSNPRVWSIPYVSRNDAQEKAKLHGGWVIPLYAQPQPMPQPVYDKSVVRRLATQWGMIPENTATDVARDAKRMDWLCHHAVNVRDPLPLGGSNDMFWASPYGDDTPSNLRTKIDAEIDAEIERIDRAKGE